MKFEIKETKINGLPATVYEPEKPIGTIVIENGFCTTRKAKYRITYSKMFAENGFKVITWDYRSFAFKTQTDTLTEDLNDLLAVIEECNCDVGLFGNSWGGLVAIHAAERSDRVKALVTRSAVIDVKKFEEEHRPGSIYGYKAELSSPDLGKDLLSYNTYKVAEKINTPVLMFVGKKDDNCLPENARKFLGSVKGEKRLVEFDIGHEFNDEITKKMTAESIAWFKKHLAQQKP